MDAANTADAAASPAAAVEGSGAASPEIEKREIGRTDSTSSSGEDQQV